MYQKDKKSNMLITALDTFDLGASVDHELFMNTLSKYKKLTTNSDLENIVFDSFILLMHIISITWFLSQLHKPRCAFVVYL